MNLAIVGASGMVGNEILRVIEELDIEIEKLYLVASEKSVGKTLMFKNKEIKIISAQECINNKPDMAIFSAGATASRKLAPLFVEAGIKVIDNSSAWRKDNKIPLIVPEVNASNISNNDMIIANPNCSTIQMVVALNPLHEKWGIKRLVISTYQSVTGSGVKGEKQLMNERENIKNNTAAYPYRIDLNILPHAGKFLDNDYTEEEDKLVTETQKILNDNNIAITATVARVPVVGGHSMSVNIEFIEKYNLSEAKTILSNAQGIIINDDPKKNIYPMPYYVKGKNQVFVGRIRNDESHNNAMNLWIVADNIRKGAATNAVQIAQIINQLTA